MAEKIVAECDECGKAYRLAAKYAGKHIRCKACGEAFEVPNLEDSLAESGHEEDLADDESEIVSPPPKKRSKSKGSPRDSATRKRAKSDGGKRGKRDADSGETRKKGRTGKLSRKGMDSSKGDAKKGRGRKKRDDSGEERKGRRGGRPGRGRRRGDEDGGGKPDQTKLFAAAGGGALLLILIIVVAVSNSGPSDQEIRHFKGVKNLLEAGEAAKGSPETAIANFNAAIKEYESNKDKFPGTHAEFAEIRERLENARSSLPKIESKLALMKAASEGQKLDEILKLADGNSAQDRLHCLTLLQLYIGKKSEGKIADYRPELEKDKTITDAIIKLTSDSDKKVAQEAESLIVKLRVIDSLPFFIRRLTLGPDARNDAILRISKYETPKAEKAYIAALGALDPNNSKEELSDAFNLLKMIKKYGSKDSKTALKALKGKANDELKAEIDEVLKKIDS